VKPDFPDMLATAVLSMITLSRIETPSPLPEVNSILARWNDDNTFHPRQ
jgi:hypothetical protein